MFGGSVRPALQRSLEADFKSKLIGEQVINSKHFLSRIGNRHRHEEVCETVSQDFSFTRFTVDARAAARLLVLPVKSPHESDYGGSVRCHMKGMIHGYAESSLCASEHR